MSHPIILFDGVCNFCNFWVNFAVKHDPQAKLKFSSLQSDAGIKLLNKYSIATTSLSSVVYLNQDKVYFQSDAVIQISKHLSGIGKFGIVLSIFPKVARDFIYNFFAKNRYRFFGKKEKCMIPSDELKHRFI
jgi:predicted DCC family thiol-disulfide oxidoreductase YuxK